MSVKHRLSFLQRIDWVLLLGVFLLLVLGLATLWSIALSQGGEADFFSFQKQLIGAGVGIGAFLFFTFFNASAWQRMSIGFYAIAIALLLGVLFFGTTLRGTTGWFVVGGFGFQPVEAVKFFLLLFFSASFARFGEALVAWMPVLRNAIFALAPVGLVMLQPDLGSAMVLFALWFGLLLIRGIKKNILLLLCVIFAALAVAGWFFVLQDYQKNRLLTFVNPGRDPLKSGYNITQARIAIGAGGLFGRGLGFGSQSQLKFLPASQTDFIFAVIAEELGLFGVTLVLAFWTLIFWRLYRAARRARDDFGLFIILGVGIIFLTQIMINIGMNLGISPVTGITLPFLSAGSSSLVASFAMVGLVESVVARS